MNRATLLAITCCALLLGGVFFFGSRIDHSAMRKDSASTLRASQGVQATPSASPQIQQQTPYPAPAFHLANIGGKPFTNESVKGKPVILWFTTTYCVPCQLGAEEVQKLDDDLGGSAFNVVMVFIDPRETDKDLLFWKKNFANPDWYMAQGNDQLLTEYQIRALDTQYLVDKEGNVREVNYGLVGYDDYKEKITPLL